MTRLISLFILLLLVIALGFIFFEVMVGFFIPLFLALVLTILFRPLHLKLTEKLHGYDRVAAAVTTVLILVIVIAPVAFVIYRAATDALPYIHGKDGRKIDRQQFENVIDQLNERFQWNLSADEVFKAIAERAKQWFGPLAERTPAFLGSWLIGHLVLVFALYYFMADGDELLASSSKMLPLDVKYQRQLTIRFVDITRAVVLATIVTALSHGVLMAIGYYFAGLGSVVLLMMLTIFAAFVPAIGSFVVWGPACLWLFFTGHPTAAILLAVWCSVVVILADNILRPALLHGQSNIHPLLALLSVIGGVELLGPMGLFIGPMAVAFLQTGLQMLNSELQQLKKTEAAAASGKT